jgi:transposase
MPAAHSKELAWRVVMRYDWYNQSLSEICDPHTGLAVSRHYVQDVLQRYETTGDVETHQGQGADHWSRRVLTRADHFHIIKLISETPRATLKDHRAQFVLESGVVIPYSSFCSAVHQLGFTRTKVGPTPMQRLGALGTCTLSCLFVLHSFELVLLSSPL